MKVIAAMAQKASRIDRVRYLVCWLVLLLSLVLFPSLSWLLLNHGWLPEPLGQILFFWPQYLFFPNGLTQQATLGEGTYADGIAIYLAIAFWALALAVYVRFTRSVRAWIVYAALIPTVYLIMQLGVYMVLALFGFGVVLDGP